MKPLKIVDDKLAEEWVDIANRQVSKETVENYIELAHEKNMMAMNYNLLFGAYENYEQEGVKKEWGLFSDPIHEALDYHPLPDNWASDIHLMNPANPDWQQFIFNAEKEVFLHLPFDGWHVDQLGDRGTRWDYKGDTVSLAETYVPFLQNAKEQLEVPLVMNAVEQFGQPFIARQAPVDFLYTELWGAYPKYQHLKDVIDQNRSLSDGKLNTVLAAYMNYDLSNSNGEFNTPGILLTNAVIFASGGSHLELGENMLSKEYFPHKKLVMTNELEESLVRYYDFLVAYQNLLRDGAEAIEKEVNKAKNETISNVAEQGEIWSFATHKDKRDILHYINFSDASTMEWRDNEGTQKEPQVKEDLEITVSANGKAEKVWVASPDSYQGSAMELDFNQKGDTISFTLPKLKYWDMVVVEYK